MYYREYLGYPYPNRSDEHMINVKHLRDTNFDENYNYLDKSFWYKIKRIFLFVALNVLVFFIATIVHGVKIYGRKEFKKTSIFIKMAL